ncbi:uncharacterized protein METZ01_LOCUS4507 [marine metagenome]|uniref:Uncharacterized protein n=1 Tax=marine metagenome TaxID=408172 RepID=A0A381NDP5_9ZZZZ
MIVKSIFHSIFDLLFRPGSSVGRASPF